MVQADDHRAPGRAQPRHRFVEGVGEIEPRGGHHERQSAEQGQDDPGQRGQQKGLFDAEAVDWPAGGQEQRARGADGDGAGGDKNYPVGMTDRAIRQRGHEHADSEHSQEYADYVENRPNHFRRSHFVLVIERMTGRHAAKRECGERQSRERQCPKGRRSLRTKCGTCPTVRMAGAIGQGCAARGPWLPRPFSVCPAGPIPILSGPGMSNRNQDPRTPYPA